MGKVLLVLAAFAVGCFCGIILACCVCANRMTEVEQEAYERGKEVGLDRGRREAQK